MKIRDALENATATKQQAREEYHSDAIRPSIGEAHHVSEHRPRPEPTPSRGERTIQYAKKWT